MLTPRQNFNEVIKGGKPERFVKQYEFIKILSPTPFQMTNPNPKYGEHRKLYSRKRSGDHSLTSLRQLTEKSTMYLPS